MEDGFKWFGEGFDGFPKLIPEDCVEYSIYVVGAESEDIDVRDKLRQVQNAASQLTKQLLKGFIWQREAFALTLERQAGRSILHGRTNYGDSINDEWLVVYILRELSRQFPDIWVRVIDADGQFLLIEAANALPIWLNPEIADFRVWINNGKLLLIPLEEPGGRARGFDHNTDNLTLEKAIAWITNPKKTLLHSSKIEVEAFFRLQKYPGTIADSLHNALTRIPRKLAYILRSKAEYISPAVDAFYLRDPIALKPLQTRDLDSLTFPPNDLVTTLVKFTKVGYAQLTSQQFSAPPAWARMGRQEADAKIRNQADTGMKLACGFEMLMADPQHKDKPAVREIAMLLEDLEAGEAQLPSDDDLGDGGLEDEDDSWLDINYEEFEENLAGRGRENPDRGATNFGANSAQENLKKIVERFENVMKDEEAGLENADYLDDIDDDDDDDSSQQTSTTSDAEANFNEVEFTAMMRETMGMPADVMEEMMSSIRTSPSSQRREIDTAFKRSDEVLVSSSEDEDEGGIDQAMQQTEKELRDAGILEVGLEADGKTITQHEKSAT
ncbi:MAG: hypothetical protein Q9163_002846 [Psora crenata]